MGAAARWSHWVGAVLETMHLDGRRSSLVGQQWDEMIKSSGLLLRVHQFLASPLRDCWGDKTKSWAGKSLDAICLEKGAGGLGFQQSSRAGVGGGCWLMLESSQNVSCLSDAKELAT